MRCFIAVDLSREIASRVGALQREIENYDVKLVEPKNLHFTMKFLGEVDMKTIGEVEARLRDLASRTRVFHLDIENIGVFPSEKFIRVVWVGGKDLLNLQLTTEDALAGLFKREKPTPHLTIARARSQRDADKIREFVATHRNIKIGSMHVKEIKIKKSTVTSRGPIYEDMRVFELMA